jgi:hypothetical protein
MKIATWEFFIQVSNDFDEKGHFPYCTDAIDGKHIKAKHPSDWAPCFIITGCNRNKWYIYKTGLRDYGEENDVGTIIAIMPFPYQPTRRRFRINAYCNVMCVYCRRYFGWRVKTLKLLVMWGIQGWKVDGTWSGLCLVAGSGTSGAELQKAWCREKESNQFRLATAVLSGDSRRSNLHFPVRLHSINSSFFAVPRLTSDPLFH